MLSSYKEYVDRIRNDRESFRVVVDRSVFEDARHDHDVKYAVSMMLPGCKYVGRMRVSENDVVIATHTWDDAKEIVDTLKEQFVGQKVNESFGKHYETKNVVFAINTRDNLTYPEKSEMSLKERADISYGGPIEVHNVENEEVQTFAGISPREAVIAAYAQSKGDKHTHEYEKKYGSMPKRGKYGWVLGNFWARDIIKANEQKESEEFLCPICKEGTLEQVFLHGGREMEWECPQCGERFEDDDGEPKLNENKKVVSEKKVLARDEFKVGDVIDTQGVSNMKSPVVIREIERNTIKFKDADGQDYYGMARATVRSLIQQGAWKRIVEPKVEMQGVKEALDKDDFDSEELLLYIQNDSDLYKQRMEPIIANLTRKMKEGIYDHEKAKKLWMYLVDDGAQKYVKEFGGPGAKWYKDIPMKLRREVASDLADIFKDEYESGNYEEPEGK